MSSAARRLAELLMATGVAAATACTEGLPSPARIDGLRLLAVRLDPPAWDGSGPVRATPLLVDPTGPARDARVSWRICRSTTEEDPVVCAAGARARAFAQTRGNESASLRAEDVLAAPAPAARGTERPPVLVVVVCPSESPSEGTTFDPASPCASEAARPLRDRQGLVGIRRVPGIAERPGLENPVITGALTLDGHEVSDAGVPACNDSGCASREFAVAWSGRRDTGWTVSFFASVGTVSVPRVVLEPEADAGAVASLRASVPWTAPSSAATGHLHIVVRDARGAEAFVSSPVRVTEP